MYVEGPGLPVCVCPVLFRAATAPSHLGRSQPWNLPDWKAQTPLLPLVALLSICWRQQQQRNHGVQGPMGLQCTMSAAPRLWSHSGQLKSPEGCSPSSKGRCPSPRLILLALFGTLSSLPFFF